MGDRMPAGGNAPVDTALRTVAGRWSMRRGAALLLVAGLGTVAWLGIFGLAGLIETSCSPFARTPCVRVLFLGNSYTYVNDLPAVFRHLARAGGQNVETAMVANGGETLAQHAGSPDSLEAIRRSRWQFVILQEQSEIPALASARQNEMDPAARSLVASIRAADATPILLETWAHRDGLPDASLDFSTMQVALDDGYGELGRELGVAVVPAGQAWAAVLRLDPSITLWQTDGSHPSGAGTYLVACELYAHLFHLSPVGILDAGGLTGDLARTLQTVAGEL
jgi:hypothetical protein